MGFDFENQKGEVTKLHHNSQPGLLGLNGEAFELYHILSLFDYLSLHVYFLGYLCALIAHVSSCISASQIVCYLRATVPQFVWDFHQAAAPDFLPLPLGHPWCLTYPYLLIVHKGWMQPETMRCTDLATHGFTRSG